MIFNVMFSEYFRVVYPTAIYNYRFSHIFLKVIRPYFLNSSHSVTIIAQSAFLRHSIGVDA